ncbi:MAG: hypothetical protein LM577_06260 [Thermoproteaceae archaeon]|nr:hypothetical protein [Thermoproteaceae archaeon]
MEPERRPGTAAVAPVPIPAIPARVINMDRFGSKIEISLRPPAHWLHKIRPDARHYDAVLLLPNGVAYFAQLTLHRITRGGMCLFYVRRPASKAVAEVLRAAEAKYIGVLDIVPSPPLERGQAAASRRRP